MSRHRQNDPERALRSATARSHASAGHWVVHFVTGLMVGDRRSPRRQCWGRVCLPLPSTIQCRFRGLVQNFVMPLCVDDVRDGRPRTSRRIQCLGAWFFVDVAASQWPAVAAAAVLIVQTLRRPWLTVATAAILDWSDVAVSPSVLLEYCWFSFC